MAKIKIAQNPTFTATVQLPRVGAEPEPVDFQFRYMDRVALAEMFEGWNKAREDLSERAKTEDAGWKFITEGEVAIQAQQLRDIVVGWELEDEFGDESILALVLTCTGAPKAVIDAYQGAYAPSRLGN